MHLVHLVKTNVCSKITDNLKLKIPLLETFMDFLGSRMITTA